MGGEIRSITLALALTFSSAFATSAQSANDGSVCLEAGLQGASLGLCTSYCEALDCAAPENQGAPLCAEFKGQYLAATGAAPPCEQKSCDFLDPALLFERIANIPNPKLTCDSYPIADYEYVEYIVLSDGVPQIGLGLEDQFDYTWYGYYFEYQEGSDGALPEFCRYDLTAEQVAQCRAAYEPPFSCPE